jgi:hypothetical protein
MGLGQDVATRHLNSYIRTKPNLLFDNAIRLMKQAPRHPLTY